MNADSWSKQRRRDANAGSPSDGRTALSDGSEKAASREQPAPFFRLIPQLKNTSSKIVSVLSEEGVVRYQSDPIKWLLGFDAEVLIGRSLEAFVCPASKAPFEKAVARMERRQEKFDNWQVQFQTASGGARWLEGMASNFLHDPRLGGILVYWREMDR
jgi:PAS domain S-box-containing protein